MKRLLLAGTAALALAAALPSPGRAQLLLSANDNKVVLENGAVRTLREPQPDTLSVFDLSASPPALRAEIAVPGERVRTLDVTAPSVPLGAMPATGLVEVTIRSARGKGWTPTVHVTLQQSTAGARIVAIERD